MKDTVTLRKIGKSLGFTIDPHIILDLSIKEKDIVHIQINEIIKEKEIIQVSLHYSRNTIKIGESSLGITLKKNITDRFGLEMGILLGIDVTTK